MKRFKVSIVIALITCLFTQSTYANELAIWDKLKTNNAKGYVLLLRHALAPGVGDPANFKKSAPPSLFVPFAATQ